MNIDKENPHRSDKSPFYHLVGSYNCKVQEYEMSQNIIAPAAWMLAIATHKPAMVIEIGTCKGGLSSLLSSVVETYDGGFVTFDIRKREGECGKYELYGRGAMFGEYDCFQNVDHIKDLIQNYGQCFLLCDGGNKPKEFNTFSKFLKSGDIIGCHDWCDETVPDYSPAWWGCQEVHTKDLELEGLKEFMPEWFRYSAWCVRQKI